MRLLLLLALATNGRGAITLVTNTHASGQNGGTSGNVNTATSTLCIAGVVSYTAVSDATVTDSKSNTWTGLTKYTVTALQYTKIFYVVSPTTDAAHNFTVTSAAGFSSLVVACFAGTKTSTPFDVENGASNAGANTTLQTGSVTPSADNYLLVTVLALNATSTTPTINSSFNAATEFVNYVGSTNFGAALSYQVQTTATARSPTWAFSTSTGVAASIASFKDPGSAPAFTPRLLTMGLP